ncbi:MULTISPECIES: hypothetical protein [unclassified Lysinibacillus]|uniref:hypothetical protein n=1 Tax=unclassified Lysinibacillus TaxID=2636778 RepID=UPI0010D9F8DB
MTKESIRFVGIDPSTKTGFVILDSNGEVVVEEEIRATATKDPARMIGIAKQIKSYLQPNDKVVIEGFAYGAKGKAVDFQYGLGWLIRAMLFTEKFGYTDATPSQVKKFASNIGNAKKEDLVLPLYKKWGYEHHSDNVRDAYIMARMAYNMYNHAGLQKYEQEVLSKMIKPK